MRAFAFFVLLAPSLILGGDSLADTGAWSDPINVSQTAGDSVLPTIDIDSAGGLHIAWGDLSGGAQSPYYRSLIGGVLGPRTNLGTSTWEQSVELCVDGADRVHVAWDCAYDGSGYDWDIYHRVFSAGSWSAAVPVAQTANRSVDAALAAVPGGVFLAWEEANAPDTQQSQHYCHGKRWDGAWGAMANISGSGNYDVQQYVDPDVAADAAGTVHVVYALRMNPGQTQKLHDIWYRRYDGTAWQTPVNLSRGPLPSWSQAASIALDNQGRPHVAYVSDQHGGTLSTFYVGWDGQQWSTPLRISNNADESLRCDIAVDSSNAVHVVWSEKPGEVFHRTLSGGSWSAIANITRNAGWSTSPDLAVDALGTLHLVYQDSDPGNTEIFYRYLDTVNLPSRTPTPTPTNTPTPTVTLTPTQTSTPRASRTPTPTGPAAAGGLRLW